MTILSAFEQEIRVSNPHTIYVPKVQETNKDEVMTVPRCIFR